MFTNRSVTIQGFQKSMEPSLHLPGMARLGKVRMSWALKILVPVALLHLMLFLVASRHGFDLTDEAFYFMYLHHWRESPIFSFFGAYLEIPYLLAGGSVWALRIFGFVLLCAGGYWFACELFNALDTLDQRATSEGRAAPAIAAAMTVWNYYGGFLVPYTPSYNLLSLACALFSVALSLRIGRRIYRQEHQRLGVAAFVLGLIASIGIANKFTGGSILLCLNGLILLALGWRKIGVRAASMAAACFAAGLLSNWIILVAIDPGVVVRLQHGLAIQWATYPRDPVTELMTFGFVEIPNAVAQSARILMWPTLFGLFTLGLGWRTSRRRLAVAVALTGFVVGAMLDTYVKDNRVYRIVLMSLIAVLLAAAAMWMQRQRIARVVRSRSFLVGAVVLCVPFAYSFGTNNPLSWHMAMAAVFPSTLAISHIRAIRVQQLLPGWALILCLGAFATLPAEIVVRQWTQGKFTYRLGAPLAAQSSTIEPNVARIDVMLEPRVANGIAAFLKLTRESGFKAGQPMIDFTGQSPGLVLICGGFPLSATWLIGGLPFDGDTAARVAIGYVEPSEIRNAWLLTSRDSFARIATWQDIVRDKVGEFTHEPVGHVSMPDPTSNDKSKTIEVTLWRPRGASRH